MKIATRISNYQEENERLVFAYLLFFHVFVGIFLYFIAHTEYLSSLHNGEGFWHFAKDANLYHKEALNLVEYMHKSEWANWWKLYPDHQNVKIISLVYWVTNYQESIIFEAVNGTVWAASVLLIYKTAKLLFPDSNATPLIAVVFFFQPSVLIASTQLLRDPFFILGFSFIFYGITIFSKKIFTWKWAIMIQIGVVLVLSMRPYLGVIILIFMLLSIIPILKNKSRIIPFFLMISSLALFELYEPNRYVSVVKLSNDVLQPSIVTQEQSQPSIDKNKYSVSILDTVSNRVSSVRAGFKDVNLNDVSGYSGSRIDVNHKYNNFIDILEYFPRAMQVGFLSPFPSSWLKSGKSTGEIGRLLAGIEMIVWYMILIGFTYLLFKDPYTIKPFIMVFLFSLLLILLLAYVVPNVGAIFRMRQAYMIPFFIFGVHGLRLMAGGFFKKLLTSN